MVGPLGRIPISPGRRPIPPTKQEIAAAQSAPPIPAASRALTSACRDRAAPAMKANSIYCMGPRFMMNRRAAYDRIVPDGPPLASVLMTDRPKPTWLETYPLRYRARKLRVIRQSLQPE